MDKEKIRSDCSRLFLCNSLKDSIDLPDINLEYLFKVISDHRSDEVQNAAADDATIIQQMIFTKVAYLRSIIGGFSYQSSNGQRLDNLVDPTVIASLIRNIYESIALFNLIYRNPINKDEKTILYNLWVYSGLKYRQGFEDVITKAENRDKYNREKN